MGPTPFGLYVFAVMPAPASVVLPDDLIDAIYQYWIANTDLTAAFPGGLKVRQSEFGAPLPRAVVFSVGNTPSEYTTGDGYVFRKLVQFSIFASNYEDSKRLAYLVQRKYHKNLLAFAIGYTMAAFAGEPMEMPPEVAPGASEEYQHVVEVRYVLGRSLGTAA
jgi:hypothetical protein